MILENERILLRHWEETDADALYRYASDAEVGLRAGWPPHQSVEESREVIRTDFNCDTIWAIVLKSTNEPIGAMGYFPGFRLHADSAVAEPLVGYWVGRPYWNQGICTDALKLMIEHVCRDTDFNTLVATHFLDNPASGCVMKKCGFAPTGETIFDDRLSGGLDKPLRVMRIKL